MKPYDHLYKPVLIFINKNIACTCPWHGTLLLLLTGPEVSVMYGLMLIVKGHHSQLDTLTANMSSHISWTVPDSVGATSYAFPRC